MKNHIKWLGIIALVAVIGLSFAACGGSDPEKTLIITGIPAEYLTNTSFAISISKGGGNPVAMGNGQLSGSTITYDLYIAQHSEGSYSASDDRWTDKGTFDAQLWVIKGGNFIFYYANINIKGAVTTIPFSQFHQ